MVASNSNIPEQYAEMLNPGMVLGGTVGAVGGNILYNGIKSAVQRTALPYIMSRQFNKNINNTILDKTFPSPQNIQNEAHNVLDDYLTLYETSGVKQRVKNLQEQHGLEDITDPRNPQFYGARQDKVTTTYKTEPVVKEITNMKYNILPIKEFKTPQEQIQVFLTELPQKVGVRYDDSAYPSRIVQTKLKPQYIDQNNKFISKERIFTSPVYKDIVYTFQHKQGGKLNYLNLFK